MSETYPERSEWQLGGADPGYQTVCGQLPEGARGSQDIPQTGDDSRTQSVAPRS